MLRKFVVILTMLLCGMATQVYALGLGSVSVESSLNQPLLLHIELLQLGDTALEDVSVRMASPDDFQNSGIERVGFLSNVRINVEARATGNVLVLSSSQLVREPYLSFILETRWPRGRLLSEHTVLFDLPVFNDQQATAAVRQPISPVLTAPEPAQPATQPAVVPGNAPVVNPASSNEPVNSGADLQPEVLQPRPAQDSLPEAASTATDDIPAAEVPAVEQQDAAAVEVAVEPEPAVAEPEPVEVEPEPVEAEPEVELEVAEDNVLEEEIPAQVAVEEEPPVEVALEEEPPAEVAVEEETAAEPEQQLTEQIETTSTDTLSAIAMRVRPDNSVSMQQTMLAIQQLNPDAFAGGNINRLRSGEVLRIPSLAEIEAIDARQALDEVASQSQQIANTDIQPLAAPAAADPVQDDVQQGRLTVVSSDDQPADADSTTGAGSDEEEDSELDQRIAQLQTQLAERQAEAERARLEMEELNFRLQNLESQIAATQEIIRLQDIRLAQLQDSLEAAAEIAEQEAALAAAQSAAAEPVEVLSNRGLLDELYRILGSNNMFMIFGLALVVLLLVLLLVRRSNAAKHDDEEIDEIAEQAFDGSVTSEPEEKQPAEESDYQDFDASDLDSELNEIIGMDEESGDSEEPQAQDTQELDLDVFDVEDADRDAATMELLANADKLADESQFDSAIQLLNEALVQQDSPEVQQKLQQIIAAQSERIAAEEQQAGGLVEEQDPDVDTFLEEIEIESFDDAIEDAPGVGDAVEQSEEVEITDFDSFGFDAAGDDEVEILEHEDEVEILAPEEALEEVEFLEPETEGIETLDAEEEIEEIEILEPDAESDTTMDFSAEPPAPTEQYSEAGVEDTESDTDEIETFEFSADEAAEESVQDSAGDAEDIEIDTLEFEAPSPADETPQPQPEEDPDLETFSFFADDSGSSEAATPTPEGEEVSATEDELETFDFKLDETGSESSTEESGETEQSSSEEAGTIDLDEAIAEESLDAEEDLPKVELELAEDDEDDLEFLTEDFDIDLGPQDDVEEIELLPNYDESESATKLELAYAYQKMGDPEGAKEILREVLKEGNEEQIAEAKGLLDSIDGSTD